MVLFEGRELKQRGVRSCLHSVAWRCDWAPMSVCEHYFKLLFWLKAHDVIWSICNCFTGAPSNKTVVGSSGNIVPRPVSQPAHGHEAADGSRPSRHGVQQDERRKLRRLPLTGRTEWVWREVAAVNTYMRVEPYIPFLPTTSMPSLSFVKQGHGDETRKVWKKP